MQEPAPSPEIQIPPLASRPVPFLNFSPVVVCVDEDAAAQERLQSLLAGAGCQTIAVSNATAALECVWEHLPDLVVLDHTMADGEGIGLCRRLREHPETHRIPIVLHSAQSPPKQAVLYDCACAKPAERSAMLLVVRTLLMLRE